MGINYPRWTPEARLKLEQEIIQRRRSETWSTFWKRLMVTFPGRSYDAMRSQTFVVRKSLGHFKPRKNGV